MVRRRRSTAPVSVPRCCRGADVSNRRRVGDHRGGQHLRRAAFLRRPGGDRCIRPSGPSRYALRERRTHGPDLAWLSSGVPACWRQGWHRRRPRDRQRATSAGGAAAARRGELRGARRADSAAVARRAGAGAVVLGTIFHPAAECRNRRAGGRPRQRRGAWCETVRGTDVFCPRRPVAAEIRDVSVSVARWVYGPLPTCPQRRSRPIDSIQRRFPRM